MHIHLFSAELIALNEELATGYHPQLYPLLANQESLEDKVATICTHLGIVIDGAFSEKGMNKLYDMLKKEYYSFKELALELDIPKNTLKRITKNLKLYKEGYKRSDVIFKIMGEKFYSEEMIVNLTLDKLIKSLE